LVYAKAVKQGCEPGSGANRIGSDLCGPRTRRQESCGSGPRSPRWPQGREGKGGSSIPQETQEDSQQSSSRALGQEESREEGRISLQVVPPVRRPKVTVCVGVCSEEGAVLAADSQITYQGSHKTYAPKLTFTGGRGFCLGLAGSGYADLMEEGFQEIKEGLSSLKKPTEQGIRRNVKKSLAWVRRSNQCACFYSRRQSR